MSSQPKTLFVFDFDHTLVDDNTDTWVMAAQPALGLQDQLKELRERFTCWTDLMDWVMGRLHLAGCGKQELLEHMRRLTMFEQALEAVRGVKGANGEAIIISDSNSVFIECILSECGVEGVIQEVFTNPAHFDPSGRLRVSHHHSHSCQLCSHSPNMCKGSILAHYLEQRKLFGRVVYVGDGRGDLCPCMSMSEKDHIVCREGYVLAERLRGMAQVKATVHMVDFVKSLGDYMCSMFYNETSSTID